MAAKRRAATADGTAARVTRDAALRRFATRTLTAYGATVQEAAHGCLDVTPGPLAPDLGREPVVLAFDRGGLVRHESAHLVATGSPFLGRLMAIARSDGAATCWRFPGTAPPPERLAGSADTLRAEGRRTWVRLYRLHVQAAIHAAEHAQQLITLVWDPQSHACLDGADLPQGEPEFQPAGSRARGGDRAVASTGAELRTALEQAQGIIEARLRKTVKRLQASAEEQLDRRLAALASYYRELLAEEGDRKGRARTATDGERATRLKLEWERKISTEREHVAPRGTLRLVAVEELWTPRSVLTVSGEPAGRVVLWDHAAGVALRMTCRRCTVRHPVAVRARRGGGFICVRCSRLDGPVD